MNSSIVSIFLLYSFLAISHILLLASPARDGMSPMDAILTERADEEDDSAMILEVYRRLVIIFFICAVVKSIDPAYLFYANTVQCIFVWWQRMCQEGAG